MENVSKGIYPYRCRSDSAFRAIDTYFSARISLMRNNYGRSAFDGYLVGTVISRSDVLVNGKALFTDLMEIT